MLGPGTQQSRNLCSLKQRERALRVAGMMAAGGGDVRVAVQRSTLMAKLRSEAITRGAFPVLTSDLSSW
jgi:hypothetical protein